MAAAAADTGSGRPRPIAAVQPDRALLRVQPCRTRAGPHAINELAWQSGTASDEAFRTTVNSDVGRGLLINWLLANRAPRELYMPGSYLVQVPESQPYPSDHRLVAASFAL